MDCNQKKNENNSLKDITMNCSDIEIKKLLLVLSKHEDFERMESKRIKMLECEMNFFRKIVREIEKQNNHCSICNSLFIFCINPINICQLCLNEECNNCMVFIKSPKVMQLCKLCHKEWLKQVKSGNWLLEMARNTNRQILVSERNMKLSLIYKEIERQLQEKPEVVNVKTQIENLLNKKDNSFINKFEPLNEVANLYEFISQNGQSKENFSKSSSASKLKAIVNLRKNYEKVNNQDRNERPSSRNSQSLSSSEKYNKINSRSVVDEEIKISDRLYECDNQNGIIQNDNGSNRNISRSSANSYSSVNSSEYFTNDFIVQGEILLKIEHIQTLSLLKITIIKCRNLIIANKKENTTNPYVKLYLLPDKSSNGKRKTCIKKNITSPIFNEEIIYKIDRNSLIGRTLNVSVWHQETLKGNLFLGESNITIYNVKLKDPQECWYSLKTKEFTPQVLSLFQYKGEILIGLQFIENKRNNNSETISNYDMGKLYIFIRNGKHIGDEKNIPNSFIRCTMKHLDIEVGKKETKVVYNTTNPMWDEVFTFTEIDKEDLKDTNIEFFILNKKLTKTQPLGKLLFSTKCSETNVSTCREKDITLWTKFLKTLNQEIVEDYLPLRSITE